MDEVEDIELAALRSPAAIALGERLTTATEVSDGTIPPGVSCDAGQAPSWRVKVPANGVMLNRRFADAAFGGELAALVVARAYREAVLAFVSPHASRDGGGRKRRGTAAMPGVHYKAAQVGRSAAWFARTVLPDGRVNTAPSQCPAMARSVRAMPEAERVRMLAAEKSAVDESRTLRPKVSRRGRAEARRDQLEQGRLRQP